jgi:hypothetical protein
MTEYTPAPAEFRDRSAWLTAFGILTIILGAFCALSSVGFLFGQVFAKYNPDLRGMPGLGYAAALYGCLAAVFIWLGIGSIKARRWARALLAILSWGGLVFGGISVIFSVFLLPRVMASGFPSGEKLPPGFMPLMMAFSVVVSIVLYVVIPAVAGFFYSSKDAKATCELRDPVTRWTDRCPLPVLALSLLKALGAVGMLASSVSGMAVLPFFGNFLAGLPAVAVAVCLAAIWCWVAWALYRLDIRGWWASIAITVLVGTSTAMTYSRHSMTEMFRLMGYPQRQLDIMQAIAMPQWVLVLKTFVWALVILGYLLYIRRYFRKV